MNYYLSTFVNTVLLWNDVNRFIWIVNNLQYFYIHKYISDRMIIMCFENVLLRKLVLFKFISTKRFFPKFKS